MSDLVGNPEDRFSRVEAQIYILNGRVFVMLSIINANTGIVNNEGLDKCTAQIVFKRISFGNEYVTENTKFTLSTRFCEAIANIRKTCP